MARPLKEGLDYFPFDVIFFSDIKIRRLVKACGSSSPSVIICLLCNIYQDKGYYIEWNKDLPFLIADAVGVSEGNASEIITKSLQVGLFDQEVFDNHQVLTSEGIQRRYINATERRKKNDWIKEYLVGSIKKEVIEANNKVNVSNNHINVSSSTQSKVKESKVKNISPQEEIIRGGDFFNSINPENDGKDRNWERFKAILKSYKCSENDFRKLSALTNYGEIGNPIWSIFHEITNSGGKINQPIRFIFSKIMK